MPRRKQPNRQIVLTASAYRWYAVHLAEKALAQIAKAKPLISQEPTK